MQAKTNKTQTINNVSHSRSNCNNNNSNNNINNNRLSTLDSPPLHTNSAVVE